MPARRLPAAQRSEKSRGYRREVERQRPEGWAAPEPSERWSATVRADWDVWWSSDPSYLAAPADLPMLRRRFDLLDIIETATERVRAGAEAELSAMIEAAALFTLAGDVETASTLAAAASEWSAGQSTSSLAALSKMAAEVRQIEDRFAMSPRSLDALKVTFVDPVEEASESEGTVLSIVDPLADDPRFGT